LVEGVGNKGLTPERILGLNLYNQKSLDFITLVVPYTFKLLIQEMEGMMIQVRFDVSRLRRILPENISQGEIAELTSDMLDEMMEDDATTSDDEAPFTDDYEFDMGEDDDAASQAGGADEDENSEVDNSDAESADDKTTKGADSADETSLDSDKKEPSTLLPTNNIQPAAISQTLGTMPVNSTQSPAQPMPVPLVASTAIQYNPNLASLNPPALNPVSPNMEVSPMSGGGDSQMEQGDLSAYGGVKPDFDVMEREDDKAIENLNAQLLGIQTGGQNESLERAKQEGIESVISNPQQPSMPPTAPMQPMQMQNGGNMQNQGGLNFSFNQQETAPRPQLSMPAASQQPIAINQSAGGLPQKQVSFNNDIKVVELDTKISEGFLYSGSKNLDPFGQ